MSDVSFVTKCWQGDYEKILNIDRLRQMYHGNKHEFKKFKIWLNNFDDDTHYQKANELLDNLITQYSSEFPLVKLSVRDEVHKVPEVNKIFEGFAFHVSVCEYLTMKLETGPVLYTCGDILVHSTFDWITAGIKILYSYPNSVSAAPGGNWNFTTEMRKMGEVPIYTQYGRPFIFEGGYSDQCNLYHPERMQKIQFLETPNYWFEVHVDRFMKKKRLLRAIIGGSEEMGFVYHTHDSVNS